MSRRWPTIPWALIVLVSATLASSALQWLQGKSITFAYSRVRPELAANLARMHLLQGHQVFETNRAAVAALRPDSSVAGGSARQRRYDPAASPDARN